MDGESRILLLTRNFPPLIGGMERLNWHLADELSKYADVRVVAPRGASVNSPKAVRVEEVPLRPLWLFLTMITLRGWVQARGWRPGSIVAGSGLTALPAWLIARLIGVRSVVYLHGLDVEVQHPIYRMLWYPILRRMDLAIANSHATARAAHSIGIKNDRMVVIHPGVELPPDDRDLQALDALRVELDVTNRPVLISVGRLSARKGLREFVSEALPQIASEHPNVVLLIVGEEPRDALKAPYQTRKSILEAAGRSGVKHCVKFLGSVTEYERLSQLYRLANVHVFPVREISGDPEGFGMVAVEAAAHGVPTVAFRTGGVPDAVADGVTGKLIDVGNYGEFAQAVASEIARGEIAGEACVRFGARFSWGRFGSQAAMQLTGRADG